MNFAIPERKTSQIMTSSEGQSKRDGFFLSTRGGTKTKGAEKPGKFQKKNRVDPEPEDGPAKEGKGEKKPFDKKTYRLKKYSNKYKLDKWEDTRRKKMLRTYYKEVKNNVPPSGKFTGHKFDQTPAKAVMSKADPDEDIEGNEFEPGHFVKHPTILARKSSELTTPKNEQTASNRGGANKRNDAFWKAKNEFKRIQVEKHDKKKAALKAKEEQKAALDKYKQKKLEKFKKLNRKTKKGQPVMAGRLELMLEKIQAQK